MHTRQATHTIGNTHDRQHTCRFCAHSSGGTPSCSPQTKAFCHSLHQSFGALQRLCSAAERLPGSSGALATAAPLPRVAAPHPHTASMRCRVQRAGCPAAAVPVPLSPLPLIHTCIHKSQHRLAAAGACMLTPALLAPSSQIPRFHPLSTPFSASVAVFSQSFSTNAPSCLGASTHAAAEQRPAPLPCYLLYHLPLCNKHFRRHSLPPR